MCQCLVAGWSGVGMPAEQVECSDTVSCVIDAVWCAGRWLNDNDLTGTLPTELGVMTALTALCAHTSL